MGEQPQMSIGDVKLLIEDARKAWKQHMEMAERIQEAIAKLEKMIEDAK